MPATIRVRCGRAVAAALLFLAIPFGIHAGEPRYGDMVLTDDKEHPADRHEYTPDTPKIFLLTTTVEVPEGSRLEAVWIAATRWRRPTTR